MYSRQLISINVYYSNLDIELCLLLDVLVVPPVYYTMTQYNGSAGNGSAVLRALECL